MAGGEALARCLALPYATGSLQLTQPLLPGVVQRPPGISCETHNDGILERKWVSGNTTGPGTGVSRVCDERLASP